MKLKVAVLFGGESVEHEVSVISASQAMAALDPEKYEVIPIYISKQRKFYCGSALWDLSNYRDLDALLTKVTQVVLVQKDGKVVIDPAHHKLFGNKPINTIDVAIPVIHGTNGEDGTIQGFLEMLKLPYAGCDVTAAAIGQDKVLQKHVLQDAGLPLTPWFWIWASEYEHLKEQVAEKALSLGYPIIIKPANLGSSVGITIAHNATELEACIQEAAQYDFKICIEKVVDNLREINASVLGDSFKARVSVLEEVRKHDEILSFTDKYQSSPTKGAAKGSSKQGMASQSREVPAHLDEKTTQKIRQLALRTFNVLGASGVCRIDFMMDGRTGQVVVNEINTIPGSLAYYLWKEEGIQFPQLMDELVQLALDRYRRKERMIFSYDTNLLSTYNPGSAKGAKGAKQ